MAGRRRVRDGRSRVRTAVISVVVVVAIGALALGSYWFLTADRSSTAGGGGEAVVTSTAGETAAVADPAVAKPALALAPQTDGKSAPTAAGIAATLAPVLDDPTLGAYTGIVRDAATGEVLWENDSATVQIPASTEKLLTGAALLTSVKDPNSRLTTQVVQGEQAGDIVFVGGGDVTLSAATTGVRSVYDGAPTVADLAQQVKDSGVEVKRILLDTSYWKGDELAPGWKAEDIRGGYITRMQALMVDGDREDPANDNSRRTGRPAQTAGKALARALGHADLPVVEGVAPKGAQVLASVQSQPLSILLSQALLNSDNVLAESLAREVAGAKGAPRSFDGATAAISLALQDLGVDMTGVDIYDGSGMSDRDRVSPGVMGQILVKAVTAKPSSLRYLLAGLPVAGVSGTLGDDPVHQRFDDPRSAAGRGWVRAKTGSLNSTLVLAGYVPDVDGRNLVFSLVSNASIAGNELGGTRSAQDWFTTLLRGCGCR